MDDTLCARCFSLDLVAQSSNIEVYEEADKPGHVREVITIKLSDCFCACCPLCSFIRTVLSIDNLEPHVNIISANDMNEKVMRDRLLQDQGNATIVEYDAEPSIEVEHLRYNEFTAEGFDEIYEWSPGLKIVSYKIRVSFLDVTGNCKTRRLIHAVSEHDPDPVFGLLVAEECCKKTLQIWPWHIPGSPCVNLTTEIHAKPSIISHSSRFAYLMFGRCLVEFTGHEKYAALSYVWGTTVCTALTQCNIESFKQAGSMLHDNEELPLVLRYAIIATDKLSITYFGLMHCVSSLTISPTTHSRFAR